MNSEHKAVVCSTRTICSTAQPHMRTFWAATIGFFCTFFSCFAPGALGAYYKKPPSEGGLGLVKAELGLAGNLAVTGTILMRVAAGPMCDTWGARKTFIMRLLLGIPGMIIFAFSQSALAFTLGRILIGLSLATFVTCQVWCSQFFDRSIVGTVNATAGGWGNVGGGVTLLTMPFIMEIFLAMTGSDIGTSWRLCMIVPVRQLVSIPRPLRSQPCLLPLFPLANPEVVGLTPPSAVCEHCKAGAVHSVDDMIYSALKHHADSHAIRKATSAPPRTESLELSLLLDTIILCRYSFC